MPSEVLQQVPGIYHRQVGEITVTALNDGHLDAPLTTVRGIPTEEATAMLHAAFRPVPRRTAVNTFLIRAGGRTALVDTGCGGAMRPTVGFMPTNLAAAGVPAAEIDTVLMTHLHPDHFGGLANPDGTRRFPNAELVIHPEELAYWNDDAQMMRVEDPAFRKMLFGDARAMLALYEGRVRPFTGDEVFPGVVPVSLPGHTPGHSGYLVSSGAASLLIWGDIVHVQELQVPRPEVTMSVDVDPATMVTTRRRIFEQVAVDRQAIAGMHLHFPGLAHLARSGDSYLLVPDPWTNDLPGDAEI